MSQENVDVVRQIFEAFNRRDWATWESHHHTGVEWYDPPELPDAGVHHGVTAIRRFFADLLATGDEWHVEVEEIETVDQDRVLMRGQSVLVGHASRIPLRDPLFQLFELEDGRVRRVETFRSRRDLEAAGLSEEAMSRENLETVLRTYAAFSEGDLTTVLGQFDPEVISYTAAPLDPAEYRGHPGFLEWCENWLSAFDEFGMEVESHVGVGEAVVLRVRQRATGAASGAPVERTFWFVHRFSRGRITRIGVHATEEQALEAAGLRE